MKSLLKILFVSVVLSALTFSCNPKEPVPDTPPDEPQQTEEEDLEAALMRLDLPPVSVEGEEVVIKGLIQNLGEDTIRSLEITWSVDNGDEHTATFDNLELAQLDLFAFEHPQTYTAEFGTHTFEVEITDVNGKGDDKLISNNIRTATVEVASQSVPHTVLFEEFTSSTCSPCFTFNTYVFNEDFLNRNRGKYTLIKYQMYWPGQGDPYYIYDGGVRREYYGVNGVPTLIIDGDKSSAGSQSALQAELDLYSSYPGVMDLEAYHYIDSVNQNVKVKVYVTPYVTGDYVLRAAVVEKTTYDNATVNGEDKFFNVLMKMVPNAEGVPLHFTDGRQIEYQVESPLSNRNIEEYSDLAVVVFIQNDDTKFVYQSVYSVSDSTQVDDF